jgi:hypothetical protein
VANYAIVNAHMLPAVVDRGGVSASDSSELDSGGRGEDRVQNGSERMRVGLRLLRLSRALDTAKNGEEDVVYSTAPTNMRNRKPHDLAQLRVVSLTVPIHQT